MLHEQLYYQAAITYVGATLSAMKVVNFVQVVASTEAPAATMCNWAAVGSRAFARRSSVYRISSTSKSNITSIKVHIERTFALAVRVILFHTAKCLALALLLFAPPKPSPSNSHPTAVLYV